MQKKQHENQYGSFLIKKSGYKKLSRKFFSAFIAVIFVFGLGFLIYNKHKATVKQSDKAAPEITTIPAWWQQQYFGSSVCAQDNCQPQADPDHDKLTNLQEYYYHTNPLNAYTVKDKLNDGELVAAGFDPSKPNHATFDQVVTPENLLGESLVFGSDIKQMVAESNDISKVNLPLVKDEELKIIKTDKPEDDLKYSIQLQSAVSKYFSASSQIGEILKNGNDSQAAQIGTKAQMLAEELKKISVPEKLLLFHKYNIALFQLLSKIVPAPDLDSSAGDVWYDNVQAFLAVQQKLDLEKQKLQIP